MPRLSVEKHDLTLTNEGVETKLSKDYQQLEQDTMDRLHKMLASYPKASRFLDILVADPEVRANWDMADYIAVSKLHYNDHGEVHHKVVAAACDMTKGRSNYALDIGSISIHTVGGVSIERVLIEKGKRKPIQIRVELSNSAGIFPVEEYLVPKVNIGDLAPHVEVIVTTDE